ncbi:hypothetical protein PVK66_00410 [Aliivibrio sp. S4MY4]|uniref:hypothetical protein n=1 Tax=unclassified Aliivibrio TaxID=2645654 RepID=UPI002377D65C|nr:MULTISPECIES: hypothetical protein [unclassified Aliivibrio]MDD9162987.1 hypothetical protein [Aliivibrio sp. S4MY2]MDD9166652.1 hypothetical protein [Aliivibrio sp. S4MY4]MDD9184064.1 hypothetical protein [Aliivibrio sp. S4MY3]MDD9200959.1 hypothetical protein [Aliivibrio sp. S4MY1]
MKWFKSDIMGKMLRKLLGIPELQGMMKKSELKVTMPDKDTIVVDMSSLSSSKVAQAQMKAAQEIYT